MIARILNSQGTGAVGFSRAIIITKSLDTSVYSVRYSRHSRRRHVNTALKYFTTKVIMNHVTRFNVYF